MEDPPSFDASLLCLIAFAPMAKVTSTLADQRLHDDVSYEVEITNLTRRLKFTPRLAAVHMPSAYLVQLGNAFSSELATLVEEGHAAPLTSAQHADMGVLEVVNGNGLIEPGATTTLTVSGRGGTGADRISVSAMMTPDHDSFFAVNGVALPRLGETLAFTIPACDSGRGKTDEICASVPGLFFAECNGSGGALACGEEHFVHISVRRIR